MKILKMLRMQSSFLHPLQTVFVTTFIGLFTSSTLAQTTPHIISFFIRPLPALELTQEERTSADQKAKKQLDTPGKILKSITKKELSPRLFYSGIYVAYAGTFTHSNPLGEVIFERTSPEAKFHLLVTEDLKSVPIDAYSSKTLYGFAPDPASDSELYLFERLQDPETGSYTWYVTHEPLKKHKLLPIDTIIIFADPKQLIVPIGSTDTTMSENFTLPDFYITQRNGIAVNALRFLKMRHYFAPVKFEYTFKPDDIQQKITD